jgi:hypothetical protein
MLYLVDPDQATKKKCPALGNCTTFCGIKPCYGVIVYE